jgi:exopolyphosphatase/guanosine-5'-triphosphate,3'-diphosphate pyrophosphatase
MARSDPSLAAATLSASATDSAQAEAPVEVPAQPGDQEALPQAAEQRSEGSGLRHVAAIDIGTNSIHLLIAAVDPVLRTFRVVQAEKSTTRLGERDPETGDLSTAAIERAFLALRHCRELATSHGVEQILTAATSAVREAPNGRQFVQAVQEQLGLDVELVSGPEEARLIYLGVLSGMAFGDDPHLILDIGGGSTELILADGRDARELTSTRLGAVRLQRDFITQDPVTPERLSFLRAFIQGSLEPAVDRVKRRLRRGERPVMVATSGTALALAALCAASEERPPTRLQGYRVSRERIDAQVNQLATLTLEQRKALPPINERRAEIIVPGALVLQQAMAMLQVRELVISERALREGLIVDWMLRHDLIVDRFAYQSGIRQRTVLDLARRYRVDQRRAEHVAKQALLLYDKTRGVLHDDAGNGRALLWAAALLHSCGQHINISAYHKHSWYLIRHCDLLGYSESEQLMVAAIARYHRKSLPKKRHEAWLQIPGRDQRRTVNAMALLLRLATSLDRRPVPAVDDLRIRCRGGELRIGLISADPAQDLSLERWSLAACREPLAEAAGLRLVVES